MLNNRNSITRAAGAFTLIELLIVVAIIAILAAIAIPNLVEAQVRAKVARVKSDMRTIAVGMEAYAVDKTAYPYFDPNYNHSYLCDVPALTTPVAYLQTLPMEVFRPWRIQSPRQRYYRYYPLEYWVVVFPVARAFQWTWLVMSNGPDVRIDIDQNTPAEIFNGNYRTIYDPTNGSVSPGDIWATNHGILGSL